VLNKAGIKVKVLQVTDAKDPDEYIKKFGASAFGRLLATARSQYSFLVDNAAEKYDLSNNEDKVNYANEVAKILSAIDNAIEADLYIKDASERTGISVEAIKSVIASIKGEDIKDNIPKPRPAVMAKDKGMKKGVDEARKSLICIMTGHPAICERLKAVLRAEEFCDEFYVTMVRAVYNAVDNGKPVIAANITSSFTTAEQQQRAAELFILQMSFDNNDELYKATSDQLRVVKESYLDEEIKKCSDPALIQNLFKEKRNINNLCKSFLS
jgi:DNA primase